MEKLKELVERLNLSDEYSLAEEAEWEDYFNQEK